MNDLLKEEATKNLHKINTENPLQTKKGLMEIFIKHKILLITALILNFTHDNSQ